jgi:hypothetical protein
VFGRTQGRGRNSWAIPQEVNRHAPLWRSQGSRPCRNARPKATAPFSRSRRDQTLCVVNVSAAEGEVVDRGDNQRSLTRRRSRSQTTALHTSCRHRHDARNVYCAPSRGPGYWLRVDLSEIGRHACCSAQSGALIEQRDDPLLIWNDSSGVEAGIVDTDVPVLPVVVELPPSVCARLVS